MNTVSVFCQGTMGPQGQWQWYTSLVPRPLGGEGGEGPGDEATMVHAMALPIL